MGERILLIEPYCEVANIICMYLEELGHDFDLVTDAAAGREHLTKGSYTCALINVDQNSDEWRYRGLRLAEAAAKNHMPVVMIADHDLDAATATSNGWIKIRKPFTLQKLESAIAKAVSSA